MSQGNPHGAGQKRWIPWALVPLVFGLSFGGQSLLLHRGRAGKEDARVLPASRIERVAPQRIVSLAPSVTEVLFALDLGDRVVGVTQHCRYPHAALAKAKVGDYYQPDYEAIVSLEPDLVILLPEHEEAQEYLDRLGVKTLMVNHFTIEGVLDSILLIGKICGVEGLAQAMTKDMRKRMETIRKRIVGLPSPRVMVSVGRNMGSEGIKDIYICGRDGFYSEMIELAGGKNVYQGGEAKFPIVSGEGILRLNPQVILDVVPDLEESGWKEEKILQQWDLLPQVDAVAHRRVHLLSQGFAVIPGPRFILILEEMARLIHPEVRWGPA